MLRERRNRRAARLFSRHRVELSRRDYGEGPRGWEHALRFRDPVPRDQDPRALRAGSLRQRDCGAAVVRPCRQAMRLMNRRDIGAVLGWVRQKARLRIAFLFRPATQRVCKMVWSTVPPWQTANRKPFNSSAITYSANHNIINRWRT